MTVSLKSIWSRVLLACFIIMPSLLWGMTFTKPPGGTHELISNLMSRIQKQDSLLLTDPQGRIIASKHANRLMTPASTLKILTSLVALHYLGPTYHFVTECYQDAQHNLKIRGMGDPLFTSDIMPEFAKQVYSHIHQYNDLVLDDSAFEQPLTIPGVTRTSEPYDAPNGALCANFNTVSFQKDHTGHFISAEPQTPLLPVVLNRIRTLNVDSGRIVFSHSENSSTLYTGHLLNWFFLRQGLTSSGQIRVGAVRNEDRLLFRFVSPYTLTEVISRLLEFSNNYIANQLFITSGITAYGLPGTIDKGIRAAQAYIHNELEARDIQVAEGSGISRDNRISAADMDQLLVKFYPYHELMRRQGSEYFKTGTLDGVRTRVGYIQSGRGGVYRFVVMINTPGSTADSAMELIRKIAAAAL
jgi:D-alanyl-D-alanine carboxypeptidase/D-alanyl-D-alanine-endopeptidase (penicillin-binding protein 4)